MKMTGSLRLMASPSYTITGQQPGNRYTMCTCTVVHGKNKCTVLDSGMNEYVCMCDYIFSCVGVNINIALGTLQLRPRVSELRRSSICHLFMLMLTPYFGCIK